MVERFQRFSLSLFEISRCWHKLAAEEMSKYDLKGPYAVYFTTLFRYPDGVTAAQLGEYCSRDKADVSRAITLLEKKGFVQRASQESKSYRAKLRLTENGLALASQINLAASKAVEQASRGLSAEKRQIFYEALELITANLQDISKQGL